MLAGVGAVAQSLVGHVLTQRSGTLGQARHPVDDVHHEMETVEVVEHHHVKRRCGRALLLVTTHVNVWMVGAAVGQTVDQPGVPVVGEDHRPLGREQRVELRIWQPVGMLAVGLQTHQVNDVDEPHLQLG